MQFNFDEDLDQKSIIEAIKNIQHNQKQIQETIEDNLKSKTWMNVEQLSVYLDISQRTIQRYVSNDKIPFSKTEGMLRFNRSQIDLWLLYNGDKLEFTKRDKKKFENIVN